MFQVQTNISKFLSRQTKCTQMERREKNRLRMQDYRANMSDEKIEKIKEYDKKRAAARRLREKTQAKKDLDEKRQYDRDRKERSRLKNQIPKGNQNFEKLCKKVASVARHSPNKREIVIRNFSSLSYVEQKPTLSVLELSCLRRQGKVNLHRELVEKFKVAYGSLRKAAQALRIPWKTFHSYCQPIKPKSKKKCKQVWLDIRKFYEQEGISTSLPGVKYTGKRYMTKTIEEAYDVYKDQCILEGKKHVSKSTFFRLRPEEIFHMAKTPDRQCICESCENFRLLRYALKRANIKGVPSSTRDIIKSTLCSVDSEAESDAFHVVDPRYGRLDCISRNCRKCGVDLLMIEILRANNNIEGDETVVTWGRWEMTDPDEKHTAKKKKSDGKSDGKGDTQEKKVKKRLDIVEKEGTKFELLTVFMKDLSKLSNHLFQCNWNYSQFVHLKENLKAGQLLQVLDFGQNYLNVYQDEPQGVHWDHTQTILHPIVNYYIPPGSEKVLTLEYIMISDDIGHDKYAVREFERVALEQLRIRGFVPTSIIQFSDNCAGQYKSRGPFQFISQSEIPTQRMFFGARHGKGPADGAVGRVKGSVRRAVKAREVIIRNAKEFADFCVAKLKTEEPVGNNFERDYFYVTNINRSDPIRSATATGTQSFYSVRSAGCPFVIEVRELGCVCESCLEGDGSSCPNQAYAPHWRAINLHTGKTLIQENFENLHWPQKRSDAGSDADSLDLPDFDINDEVDTWSVDDSDDEDSVIPEHLESYFDQSPPEFIDIARDVFQIRNYRLLENYIENLPPLPPLTYRLQEYRSHSAEIDVCARRSMPPDVPENWVPIETIGDGNCCPRSICTAIFLDDSRHYEMRLRLLIEGVTNKQLYLDNDYLCDGAALIHQNGTFPEQYAMFSGQYISPETRDIDDIVETVYEKEMLQIRKPFKFMGMWQLWAASNVLKRPVRSVFPLRGSVNFRSDFNRMCLPRDHLYRNRDPVVIMWTPTAVSSTVNHFVPLLKPGRN